MRKYFSRILAYWMALGHLIGLVMTPVHMMIVYVLAIGPANVGARLLRRDPLDRKPGSKPTFWKKKALDPPTIDNMRHTF